VVGDPARINDFGCPDRLDTGWKVSDGTDQLSCRFDPRVLARTRGLA
jgi:hypothetical protein